MEFRFDSRRRPGKGSKKGQTRTIGSCVTWHMMAGQNKRPGGGERTGTPGEWDSLVIEQRADSTRSIRWTSVRYVGIRARVL
jgi:hypothetical protein